MGVSPTQRTLKKLREDGWTVWLCEHFNYWAHKRQDLYGIIDIMGLRLGEFIGVQTTTDSNASSRILKMRESPYAEAWKLAGGRLELWTWAKHGKRGEKKTWQCRIIVI